MLPRSKVPTEKYITVGLSELPDTELGFIVTFMALQYIEIQSLVNIQEGKLKSSWLPFIPDGFYRLLRFTFNIECICSFKIYHNNCFCYWLWKSTVISFMQWEYKEVYYISSIKTKLLSKSPSGFPLGKKGRSRKNTDPGYRNH